MFILYIYNKFYFLAQGLTKSFNLKGIRLEKKVVHKDVSQIAIRSENLKARKPCNLSKA